ncbi:hypothetical protein HX095_04490 [Empedobacter falsenii]|uniref:Uncharacterized protein n=2 Tax=Empedobacter falsenii TaxID=343874 RepID=A0AAW7DF17_9FLAO|nr:hypothetical protein [Empedobacter falsenii]
MNDYQKQKKDTYEFLQDLKNDLNTDIKNITEEKNKLTESEKGITALLNLTSEQIKELGHIEMKIRFNTRKNIEANYEGFKSSGKIGNIEDSKLKTNILSYYQEYMSTTLEMEKDINIYKKDIVEMLGKNNFKTITLEDPYFRTKLELYIGTIQSLTDTYNEDIKKANETIKGIDNYLN